MQPQNSITQAPRKPQSQAKTTRNKPHTGEGNRAKTAGEMGFNLFRQQTSQGLRTTISGKGLRISGNQAIDIQPSEVIFQDIEVGQVYETQILVRNLTQTSKRIRVQQPQTSRFRVDYDIQGALAAGLAIKITVQFETQLIDDFHDSISIKSEDGFNQDIAIHALKPQPQLQFESILDIGYTKIGIEKKGQVVFTNTGKQPGQVTFVNDNPKLKIDPSFIDIQNGQSISVSISYTSNQAHVFRQEIQVIQSWSSVVRQLDISCTVVEFSIFYLDSQLSQTSMVDFGDMLMGLLKQQNGFLVNNTPIQQSFNILVRKGFLSTVQTEVQLLTPHDMGLEWLEKVITCYPQKGILEPYAQIPIKVECLAKPSEEDVERCSNYALRETIANIGGNHQRSSEIKYSMFINFDGRQKDQEQLILHVSATQVMPQLRLSKQIVNFGSCPLHEIRHCTLLLENTHRQMTIDVEFSRVPQIRVEPESLRVVPGATTQVIISYQPKNVGKVNTKIDLMLIDSQFRIPIAVVGYATFNGERRPVTRGPEALPIDFKRDPQFIDESHIEYLQTKRKQIQSENILNRVHAKQLKGPPQQDMMHLFFLDETSNAIGMDVQKKNLSEWEQDRLSEKMTLYHKSRENQQKYTEYLRSERTSRLQKKHDQIVQLRVGEMELKLQDLNDSTDLKKSPPHDYEFELGMMETGVIEPQLPLPPNTDGLFVTRPIDKYEPLKGANSLFCPDALQGVKKRFPSQPQTHRDMRDSNQDLNGEEMKKIQAGPTSIDFGRVFVRSHITRTFHIKNDLRNAISAQIIVNRDELSQTLQLPQIIPSSETARFEIVLHSNQLGVFKQSIKYIINGKYTFEFIVSATIEPASLKLSSNNFQFKFSDESLKMEVSDLIKLTNNGNASAQFKWVIPETKVFMLSVTEGEVAPGKSLDLQITYRPSNLQIKDEKIINNKVTLNNQQRQDEDRLIMKITDGPEQIVNVTGIVNDARCSIKQTILDMKEMLVCKPETRFFSIRNQSRVPAVYNILYDKLPAACDITPLQGKIMQEETKDIQVKYQTRDETDVKTDIIILIRGGRILKIPFLVRTVIPRVEIVQEQFNFGKLTTLGNEGVLKMTIINNSSIKAELILDMRTEIENPDAPDGIECLQIIEAGDKTDDSILRSYTEEDVLADSQGQHKQRSPDDDSSEEESSDNDSLGDDEKNQLKKFILSMEGNSKLDFILKFSPKDVKTYNFDLPIILNRYGKLLGLTRTVICKGLKPKFLVDPQLVVFARKIITSAEKCYPVISEIVLSNPEKKSIQWRLDLSSLNADKIFTLTPNQGRIESGQTNKLKASFNPILPGESSRSIPIYVEEPDVVNDKPYMVLVLKGSAARPKLQFDRREILLPVVPLGITSRCTFCVINDGYENLNIRTHVFGEEGSINLKLEFPEGQHLGITKKRLRVEAVFVSTRSLSFTTRIEFYDEYGMNYSIPVSGTADNSILTTYSYMQRCLGEFKLGLADQENAKGAVMLMDEESDLNSDGGSAYKGPKRGAMSVLSHSFSHFSVKSTRSVLGYTPIPQDLVEKNKENAAKWINNYLLTQNIHQFPDSVIEADGQQILDLVCLLSGRSSPLPFQANEKNQKKGDRINSLLQQYDELIRMLKGEGTLLNHIRPYHLLSFNDLNYILKSLPQEELDIIHPSVLKIPQHRFNYVSADAWCSLLYQIIKIYGLARVQSKNFKTANGMPASTTLPDYYLQGSNIHSREEGILMRWLEVHYESQYGSTSRLLSFDTDLRDGWHIAAVVQAYVGSNANSLFVGMKQHCILEDDFIANSQKLFLALQEVNLITPFSAKDFSHPSGKDMLLLVLHLYNTLPHFIPRGGPVIFQCVLGSECTRNLELQNPTSKSISYWVRYEGAPDFILDGEDSFRIEPKQTYQYKVRFVSRLGQSVTGRITFMNKLDGNATASTLVFELKSEIVGRISEQTHQVTGPLYDTQDFSIQIQNKFMNSEYGTFLIQIVHLPLKDKIVTNEKSSSSLRQKKVPVAKNTSNEIFPCVFCRIESIRLKRGQIYQVLLQFIPLVMEQYKVQVVFSDNLVGQFQHEVLTSVDLPEQMIEYKAPIIYVDQATIIEYQILLKNEAMMKAKKIIDQIMNEKKAKKITNYPGGQNETTTFDLELTGAFGFLSVPKQFTLVDKHLQMKIVKEKGLDQISQAGTVRFKPDQSKVDSDFLSIAGLASTAAEATQPLNRIPITFAFKQPVKDLVCTLTMRNSDRTDVRRYRVTVNALPKPIKAVIEIACPARETIVQEIPIVNPSDRDWTIKLQLTSDSVPGGGGALFQLLNLCNQSQLNVDDSQGVVKVPNLKGGGVQRDILVKRKSTVSLQLTFAPKWICKAEGHISMQNHMTNDNFDYKLVGIGEEPLAESHISLKCQARQTTRKEIPFVNKSTKVVEYRVETDLMNASGVTKFSVPPHSTYTYMLTVTPMLSGQYTGSVTFLNDEGEYVWYTVMLDTESPRAERDYELITQVRKPIAFDIELNNPLVDEQVTFEVSINGKDLIGEKQFTVLAGTSSTYELIYLPLVTGKEHANIGFIHSRLGEIWYTLTLISEERQSTRLPIIKAELGKQEAIEVLLENPTGQAVHASVHQTNPANFEVKPENLILSPYSQTPAYIHYNPSVLDTPQISEIFISTRDIGKWEFLVHGIGIAPTPYPQRVIREEMNKVHSEMVNFKNPFKETIHVLVSIESPDAQALEVFNLLLKNKNKDGRVGISGSQNMQLPFSFTPHEIRSYGCEMVIAMNEKIKWYFPIIGHTEAFASGPIAILKTKCRIPLEQEVKFQLSGMVTSNSSNKFSFERIDNPLIARCFKMKMIKNKLEGGEDTLVFETGFNPMKPFKTIVELIIQRDVGGVWKFPLQLEASLPDVDDLIIITSSLHKTSSVSFKLTNRFKNYANFTASFTAASDQELGVYPKSGQLEPFGREGTQFIISFTPLEYGQIKTGRLIIETDEMYWSYNVRGTLPKYYPPVAKESKLIDRLSPEIEEQITHKPKNFLMANIASQKRSPGRSNSPPGYQNPSLNQTRFNKTSNYSLSRENKLLQTLKGKKSFPKI